MLWGIVGFFAGFMVCRVMNALFSNGVALKTMFIAHIQSLRLLSKNYSHFMNMRVWCDRLAHSIDDIQEKMKAEVESGSLKVTQEDGSVLSLELPKEAQEQLTDLWVQSRFQELKSVWNIAKYDNDEWRKHSVIMVKAGMIPYHSYAPWNTWEEAMSFLAMHELSLRRKSQEEEDNG